MIEKGSRLKEAGIIIKETIDADTGEVLDVSHNNLTYVCFKKDKFWMMYSSMVIMLKKSSDIQVKMFASLIEKYSEGQHFMMGRAMKNLIAKETGCSSRSLDLAFTKLLKDEIILEVETRLYQINPRHVFYGSRDSRNQSLKAVIELNYEPNTNPQ